MWSEAALLKYTPQHAAENPGSGLLAYVELMAFGRVGISRFPDAVHDATWMGCPSTFSMVTPRCWNAFPARGAPEGRLSKPISVGVVASASTKAGFDVYSVD
jgi:hypothetical protein